MVGIDSSRREESIPTIYDLFQGLVREIKINKKNRSRMLRDRLFSFLFFIARTRGRKRSHMVAIGVF